MTTQQPLAADSRASQRTPRRLHPLWGVHPWIAKGALWISISASAVLALLYLVVGDCTWWTTWVVTWPASLWCGPLSLISLVAISPRHPRRSIAAVGSVILLTLLTVEWQSLVRRESRGLRERFETLRAAPAAENRGDTALRLVSWNIASYRSDLATALGELETLEPDLCLLQEVGLFDVSALPEGWGSFDTFRKGEFALISRCPLEHIESSRKVLGSGPQFALLHLPQGREVLIVNVHLFIPGPQWRIFFAEPTSGHAAHHRARMQQLRDLHEAIEALKETHGVDTVLLVGDFNVHGSPLSLRTLGDELHDAWRTCGLGWGGSFPRTLPMARLDQCWVTDDVVPVSARMADNISSDHRMLVVDLILPDE